MTEDQIKQIEEMHSALNELFEEYCAVMQANDPEWCIEDDEKALEAARVLSLYHNWRHPE